MNTKVVERTKMVERTTVLLEKEAYLMIRRKQIEIFNETERYISIQDLVSRSVKEGLKYI